MYADYGKIAGVKCREASAPCRLDLGGTLDIPTFHYPLKYLDPVTFNIAIDLRTRVRLLPFEKGRVKVTSRGFDEAVYELHKAPFNHPMGLVFAISSYFDAGGIHMDIDSASPPRSGLGGSSVAAVAMVSLFLKMIEENGGESFSREKAALTAHHIESSVAGVPCGIQDQLAAAFGGVNVWQWTADSGRSPYVRIPVLENGGAGGLDDCFIAAYSGIPHVSKDVNGQWVKDFIKGKNRDFWTDIISCSRLFSDAVIRGDMATASEMMNRETDIRVSMTPDVLDDMGRRLVTAAKRENCGGRFTGAGGGGCIWALGAPDNIAVLRRKWQDILSARPEAFLLDTRIDGAGVMFH